LSDEFESRPLWVFGPPCLPACACGDPFCRPRRSGRRGETFRPAIVYQGSIEKSSFNQTIHEGIQSFRDKTGVGCEEVVSGLTQQDYLDSLTEICKEGYSPVFLIYSNHLKGLATFIHSYPGIRFVGLGEVLDEPNLFSLNFAEEEGSFLAGALAAMVTKTKTIAFL